MVKMYNVDERHRNKVIDDIMDYEGDNKLKFIKMHRWTKRELQSMTTEVLERKFEMLYKLWEKQNPTA